MSKSIPVKLRLKQLILSRDLFNNIFEVAIPASVSPLLTVGTILVLTGLVGTFGTEALAGYGIGGRFAGIIASIFVAIWTYTQTWGDLFVLQMVVQGGIAFFLFANSDD